jgi:hypothetical protein
VATAILGQERLSSSRAIKAALIKAALIKSLIEAGGIVVAIPSLKSGRSDRPVVGRSIPRPADIRVGWAATAQHHRAPGRCFCFGRARANHRQYDALIRCGRQTTEARNAE